MNAIKKMSLRDRYRVLTRDLDWAPSYQPENKIFPDMAFEGIKITNWEGFNDPFRLTMDAYWKYQAEKERKLYAVLDSFAQNNAQMGITDARYITALKLFLQGISPCEYMAHRGFAHAGRQMRNAGLRVAAQMQALDELRHVQTQVHTISHFNKHFNGMHSFRQMHDRVWYLSVPKSFFDDAFSAGPFEFMVAIGFSFEYVLTNLLFVPFMSGAAFNGDLATVTFGFSAQSDEARHMTLGLEAIKFMLEQHEDNVPIVQHWIDKWFWRGYRLLGLVATMMDYMLPKKIMSWKEAWDIYFNDAGGALFKDLARYGIRMPKFADVADKEVDRVSTELWTALYSYSHATAFHTWIPEEAELEWLAKSYGPEWEKRYRPRFDFWKQREAEGKRFFNPTLPQLCQVCQIPMVFTEPDDPSKIAFRESTYNGEHYHFCSDGCKNIFDHEPEKYVQAWLPAHQIYQGNCGGATMPEVLNWYGIVPGQDNGDYRGSEDEKTWLHWAAMRNRVAD